MKTQKQKQPTLADAMKKEKARLSLPFIDRLLEMQRLNKVFHRANDL